MRSIWKGALSFGLVNVPVKLYSATEDHDVGLHQVHDADGGRIHYERRCDVCGKIVPYAHIDKAYDDGERTVVLTADDLAAMPAERSREIEVVEFVPNEQIDPIMFDKSYFLEPDGASPKAYVLLRRTLESTDRTAIVRFALRQKTRLAALRVRGDVLVLQTLLWSDEVREAVFPALDETVRISSKELELSSSLVDSYASDFTPDEFVDEYQKELRLLIERKLEQGDAIDTEATFGEVAEKEEGGEVIDLMDALRRSVESARGSKSADGAKSTGTAKKKSASSGAKSPAKKTATKSASGSAKSSTKASAKSSSKSEADTDADDAPKRKAQ
ncbi:MULTISPECIES: non-homologous end joining protein Ku [unclassified Leifsonia]|uniref:non-homologous end joining protein Ku n=1 Tax=unclassified Leifsonia TaxID=2663824 RepID=UPI0006F981DA|nr:MULTISPECIES: Ku protein [unclassified Leifsonia]KQX07268.1 Ku protein [Leifsonia sp. Root1293]KRA11551.1 Ku protein [Leifsonia sp. Root60]